MIQPLLTCTHQEPFVSSRTQTPPSAAADAFSVKLDALAQVTVKIGLAVKPGQPVVMTAPVEGVEFARMVAKYAYKAGASLVTTLYDDDQMTLARFENAKTDSFDTAADWLYEGMAKAYGQGAARLAIRGGNPSLLAGQNPEKVARANRALSTAYRPALEKITGFDINWTLVPYASAAWATTVFPNVSEKVAVKKLWDAIFAATRTDTPDPIANWKAHNRELAKRSKYLNGKAYHALHFKGPGTDLTVGLADDHEWCGGAATAKNGITCNANIPTEEVFTTPHKDRVDGFVSATKPLSYMGTLIEDIQVKFEKGRIVDAKARTGGNVLQKVLETDDGARHARRGGSGAAFIADLEERAAVLQYAVRRERVVAHRAWAGVREVLQGRHEHEPEGADEARREPVAHSHRLDDRLGQGGRGWNSRGWQGRACDAQG